MATLPYSLIFSFIYPNLLELLAVQFIVWAFSFDSRVYHTIFIKIKFDYYRILISSFSIMRYENVDVLCGLRYSLVAKVQQWDNN